jgi:porphobilinogen deaminase
VELVPITSEGDTNRASLSEIGGQGVFATALRDALRRGECDILVHSLKDLPTQVPTDSSSPRPRPAPTPATWPSPATAPRCTS